MIMEEPIQSEQYGIGFAKGNEELRDTVWAEVMKLYEAGDVTELAEKYEVADMLCLGEDASAEESAEETDEEPAEDAAEEEKAE